MSHIVTFDGEDFSICTEVHVLPIMVHCSDHPVMFDDSYDE